MRPRRFREAFAEQAGAELGRGVGTLPIMALFGALAFGPYLAGEWLERRELRRAGLALVDELAAPQPDPEHEHGTISGRRASWPRRRLKPVNKDQADETNDTST